MAQVFISYSRKDLPFVERLVSDLKKTGIDVWYDLTGLEGGSRWGIEIRSAIKSSEYVIVVLSPDSAESVWVEREYIYSDKQKKKILPLMYRECELPLGFMNVNYVDVQGENYSRNFDKITRFLNTDSIPFSPANAAVTKPAAAPARNSLFVPILGGIAVLIAIGLFQLFNAGGENRGAESKATNTSVQTVTEPESSSVTGVDFVTEMPTLVEPMATVMQQAPPTSMVMIPSAPPQVNIESEAVFLQTAAGGNMMAHYTVIRDHPSDPKALVFAMPHFSNSSQIYHKHFLAVWWNGFQWTIVNQDRDTMRHNSEFNVQIVGEGENAFVHTATAENIKEGSWTVIEGESAKDQDALVFVMPTWSRDGKEMRLREDHPVGVWYTGERWAVINLDGADMLEDTAFNVQILSPGKNAFVHKATPLNITENWTLIDDREVEMAANKLVFVTPRGSPTGTQVNNTRPMGVWLYGTQWTIFNQLEDTQTTPREDDAMPVGAEFNVLILEPDEGQ
jgi:hypothetical protein